MAALAERSGTEPADAGGDPGFAVYVHWPFCAAKCPYCDFNSHVRAGRPDEPAWLAAYRAELGHFAARTPGRTVSSVFFGGGTPSLMAPATVAGILDEIAGLWSLAEGAEVTLEANPTSVEAARFAGYRAAGVNRLSLGVQSLRDAALAALGRRHSAAEARAALRLAQATFPRVTFDLIYARPGQDIAAWREELAEALALASGHLSLYQLTIEAGTRFSDLAAAGRLAVPDDGLAGDMYAVTQDLCADAGLPAYEVSNHAAPGAESRHNLVYWRYGEYAGVGAGAHGRLVENGARRATATRRVPEAWLDQVGRLGHGLVADEPLDAAAAGREFLLMGLRLAEGIDEARYARLAGAPLDAARVGELVSLGLVARGRAGRLRATAEGRLLLDAVIGRLAG